MITPAQTPNYTMHLTSKQFSEADATLRAIEESADRRGVVTLPSSALDVDMNTEGLRAVTAVHNIPNRVNGDAYRLFFGRYATGEWAGSGVHVELSERRLAARALSLLLGRGKLRYTASFYHDEEPKERFEFFPSL